MKKIVLIVVMAVTAVGAAQQTSTVSPPVAKPGAHATAPAHPAADDGALGRVLSEMDAAAAKFQNAQADFVWDQYQRVVNETDTQKGAIYFKRAGKDVQMAAHITAPDQKYLLYTGGKMQLYQPKIDQITLYAAGKNKEDFESFLVLGFGGRGHDLEHSFEVKLGGMEELNGVRTARLDLTPKTPRLHNMFSQITLWIDTARGVSVQQKFTEPSGDYRLAKYSNIKLNGEIPNDAWKLKTTGKTKVVSPQGE